MRAKSVVLLVIALGCGLVAALGVTQVMSRRTAAAAAPTMEFTPIIVAATDIPMGDLIMPEMIRAEPWPKHKVPPSAISKLENVEGRRPKTKLYANTPILETQLLGTGESAANPTEHIPPGYRVVSVQVDEVAGAGRLIRPGDRVDLLVFMQRNPNRGILETATRTVLQDVKVFAVGDQFDLQQAEGKKSIVARTVSLLVTPRQAEVLMLATELGSIRLSLRSYADMQVVDLPGSSPDELHARTAAADMASSRGSSLAPGTPSPQSDGSEAFLQYLAAQQAKASGQSPEQSSTRQQWVMRLIQGPQLSQVVMTATSTHSGTAGQGVLQLWEVQEGTPSATGTEVVSDVAHPVPAMADELTAESAPANPQTSPAAEPVAAEDPHQAPEPDDARPDEDSQNRSI